MSQKRTSIEWVFETPTGAPDVLLADGEGSESTPVWIVRAFMGERVVGQGKGRTKKAAKNEAARAALGVLGVLVWEVEG